MSSLVNLVPKLLLTSPLHRVVSSRWAIIEFTGRKSGRRFRTPVAYVRDGDRIVLSTDSRWWRNFADAAPVQLRLRGRDVPGTATALADPRESADAIRRLVDAIPSYAKPAGLARQHGRVSDDEITRAVAAGRVGIAVTVGAGE